MGKKTRQLDFEAYAADRNTLAPFRHALHATGITDKDQQKDEQALTLELLLTGICGEVNKSLSASANDNQAKSDDGTNAAKTPILDLETLLNTNIAALLQPFVEKSDSKGPMSMLDVVTLGLTDTPDIIGFLRRHGVDLSDDRDLIYACNVLDEAIEFYDEVIAEKKARVTQKIHQSLRDTGRVEGICKIFQTAAGKHQRQLVPQACGILRIAAAVDFLNRDPLLSAMPDAEKKLKHLVEKFFPRKGNKYQFTTRKPGDVPMELVNCEIRTKTRQRIIAKLLHKPQNNAKEVVDHIGMRVTTKSAFDALRFLYFAFFKPDTAIFPGMTIDIGETRQLLLKEETLLEALQNPTKARKLVDDLAVTTIDHSDVSTIGEDEGDRNPFTSKSYRAIQITCNLPITTANGQRLHFPMELQIVDQASRADNETNAPHPDYIARQTAAIRSRVARNNLLTEFNKAQKGDPGEDED